MICKYCGYEWVPRIETPKKCPDCKKLLDRPVYDHVCLTCGYEWSSSIKEPKHCPNPDIIRKASGKRGLCRKRNPTVPKYGEPITCGMCGRTWRPLAGRVPKVCRYCTSSKYRDNTVGVPFIIPKQR